MLDSGYGSRQEVQKGRGKRKYLYLQIIDLVQSLIRDGKYRPDEKLPSMDEFAQQYGVNKLTVNKAFQEMIRQGILYTIPARGTFVAAAQLDASAEATEGAAEDFDKCLTIGLASTSMEPGKTGYYHLMLAEAIRGALAEYGASMVVLPVTHQNYRQEVCRLLREVPVDALLGIGAFEADFIGLLKTQFRKTMVLVDFSQPGIPCDTITQDNEAGAWLLTDHLLSSGVRKLSVVTGLKGVPATTERMAGLMAALRRQGIEEPFSILEGDFGRQSGYRAMERACTSAECPEAFFFMNDEMALGGVDYAREHGVSIPDAFAICGYDDIPQAAGISLTSIAAPVDDMGHFAVHQLMRRLRNQELADSHITISPKLIIRDSTRR